MSFETTDYSRADRIGLLRFVSQEWRARGELYKLCRQGNTQFFNQQTFSVVIDRLVKLGLIEKKHTSKPKSDRAMMIHEIVELKLTELGAKRKSELFATLPNPA